jgi:uncharacterized protein
VRRLFVLAALLLLAGCQTASKSQPNLTVVPLNHLPALAGDYFSIASKETGTSYHIYVRLPEGYDANPEKKYPVVYLLDGDSLFPLLAPTQLFLTYDDNLPEAILVGIAYGGFDPSINRRDIDFSATSNNQERPAGAPQFLQFLSNELLPLTEQRYRAEPGQRILLGQSRAAYFVVYSAFSNPALFKGRIASNPGMRDGEEKFLVSRNDVGDPDLKLVLSSGTKDREHNRQTAQKLNLMFNAPNVRLPWTLIPLEIQDGTHAADIGRVYRAAMKAILGSASNPAK